MVSTYDVTVTVTFSVKAIHVQDACNVACNKLITNFSQMPQSISVKQHIY
jgi:hypothetical protein